MGETSLLYLSNSEPGPYYGTPQSEYEWSFPPALLVLIFICFVGLILPSLVAKFFYFRSHQNHTPNSNSNLNHSTRSNNKDDDDDDGDGDGELSSFQSKMIAWWKDGLYIQFAARPTISEMMQESTDEIDASFDVNKKGIDTIHSSRKIINHLINTNTDRAIGPGCEVKESDIRSYYYGNNNNNSTNTRTKHHDEEDECCHDDDCGNDLLRRSCEDDDDGNVEMVSTIKQRLATASTATTRSTTTTKSTGTTRSARTTQTATAGTIREEVCNSNNGNIDDKVVFVLRLSLGLLVTGHCTVDDTTIINWTSFVSGIIWEHVIRHHDKVQHIY
mmetsp:Transcript_36359/g.41582  ORF Transcript_36359/g.41582 Transcript_36359/m.41582 type:complete len:331 (-) Transcript_36359:756-1748(-)